MSKENIIKNFESPIKSKPIKVKVKDSDDEDYMEWKKPDITPDLTAPIVTFTPPPDDTPGSSFDFKPQLTKKHLETFNGRQNANGARAVFADGDDGFESLNGYNSNGSDAENRKELLRTKNNVANEATTGTNEILVEKEGDEVFLIDKIKNEDDEKSIDSDCAIPTSPNEGKRAGVRFRSSWGRRETSYEDFNVKKKDKVNIEITHYLSKSCLRTFSFFDIENNKV